MRVKVGVIGTGAIGIEHIDRINQKTQGAYVTAVSDINVKAAKEVAKRVDAKFFETGEALTYGLFNAQERGTLFIGPGERVYSGMVVGQNAKTDDIELNVCRAKHLTNTRASGSDDALKLSPPRILSLEEALDFIDTDELLEVTPKSLRIRKKILDSRLRKRDNLKNK